MGWVKRVNHEGSPHECKKPNPQWEGGGSIWRCDDCGKFWEVKVSNVATIQVKVGWGKTEDQMLHTWEMSDGPRPPKGNPASSSDANPWLKKGATG